MSTRDKCIIMFILILIVVIAFSLKAEAGITINGTTIGCEYELAQYAYNNPYDFVTTEKSVDWLKPGALMLHNVTCECNLSSRATIGWSTAYCINHNGGDGNWVEKNGSNPQILNIIDIKWDQKEKTHKLWISCETNGKVVTSEKIYTGHEIDALTRGIYLGANQGRVYRNLF